MKIRKI